MDTSDSLHDRASALVEAARAFHGAAERPSSHTSAPESLASLEETLQLLSAAWYRLAADASGPQHDGLSREQEVRLLGALHDVAAALARCARACRAGRTTVTPILARRTLAGRGGDLDRDQELSWVQSRQPPTRRVA